MAQAKKHTKSKSPAKQPSLPSIPRESGLVERLQVMLEPHELKLVQSLKATISPHVRLSDSAAGRALILIGAKYAAREKRS